MDSVQLESGEHEDGRGGMRETVVRMVVMVVRVSVDRVRKLQVVSSKHSRKLAGPR